MLCGIPAFLAHCLMTELPTAHPCIQLQRPFQYKIGFMGCDTCRHHWTAPAFIFLQFFSACLWYSVAALLMISYSCCCIWVSLVFTALRSACALVAMLLISRSSHSIWLYFCTILGSLHCSLRAGGCSIISAVYGHTSCAGMSSHGAMIAWDSISKH